MFWSFWPIGQIPLGARLAFCRAGQPVFFPWGGASSRASLASIYNTSVHVLKLCPIQLFMFSAAGFSQFLTNKGRRVWCSREEAGFSFYFVSGPRAAFPKWSSDDRGVWEFILMLLWSGWYTRGWKEILRVSPSQPTPSCSKWGESVFVQLNFLKIIS